MDRRQRNAEFTAFVAVSGLRLARLAHLLAPGDERGQDLLQDGLIAALKAWDRIGGADGAEAYARRAMVNANTSWWRRARRHPEVLVPDVLDLKGGMATSSDSAEAGIDLLRVIRTLPARQRATIVLRFYLDLSEAETARLMGISTGTVKSQTAKALASCRTQLHPSESTRSSHE